MSQHRGSKLCPSLVVSTWFAAPRLRRFYTKQRDRHFHCGISSLWRLKVLLCRIAHWQVSEGGVRGLLCLHVFPIQDDFARVTRQHDLEALLELAGRKAMRDHRTNIESTFQHDTHLIPGLIHLPTIDAFDG